MSRLPSQAEERIDRSRSIRFSFDGRAVPAHPGDTIASAAYAGGRRVFSRSFKYHRPRGLLCCAGQCPNCLVTVDGTPNVRACTEPVRAGARVTHQNAWPSLELDAMRAVDRLGTRLTPPGFYYKTFTWPRRLWPLYRRLLRRAAGVARVADRQSERATRTDHRSRHADVLVVGGGLAGLCAARRAAELGADVVLLDDDATAGGALLDRARHAEAVATAGDAEAAGVEILSGASALGCFDGVVPAWQGDTLHQIRTRELIIATGSIEQPIVFPGNDIPGVMLSGAAVRLVRLYGVAPGRGTAIATAHDRGLLAALALAEAGVEVGAVIDAREGMDPDLRDRLAAAGVEVHSSARVISAHGRRTLERVTVRGGAREREIECDVLAACGGFVPATSLVLQAGARQRYEPRTGRFEVESLPAHVRLAGEVGGWDSLEASVLSGRVAGAQAAHDAGVGGGASRSRLDEEAERLDRLRSSGRQHPVTASGGANRGGRDKAFVCVCEDVTGKDIAHAAAEGYDSAELCKRYTTVTMGPCQGRMCQLSSIHAIARATGEDVGRVGTTSARPPWTPTPMGVLAGRPLEPAKRSALHARHRELGARIDWAGDWRRAYDYGDPHGEVLAVHERAGLIDVSSLGKLLVRGPEAERLLDRLYPNRLSNLRVGRVRYGVLLSEGGRIIDDGTVCRLSDDAFFVTTTSTGAGSVEQWISWWQAEWRLAAHVTDVTQAIGAVNLAGPRAREVLSSLTEEDCSNDAFPYLDGRGMTVAGVDCLVLRIGFVGELGYEIHCPAAHADHLWERITTERAGDGVRPFGLEAQRVLRLDKHHVIVSQDTDSESTPYGASMPWTVKKDKPDDFVGRWALEREGAESPRLRLVGIRVADGRVPREGAAVVVDGEPAGRVTSARFSPRLGLPVGLAWVPAELASDGASVTLSSDEGPLLRAEVQTTPFYDPGGERQRA